jgi:hypothetical protein
VADEERTVGGGDLDDSAGKHHKGPSGFVDEAMMPGTQQRQVLKLRFTTVFPMADVVGVAPGRFTVATRGNGTCGRSMPTPRTALWGRDVRIVRNR